MWTFIDAEGERPGEKKCFIKILVLRGVQIERAAGTERSGGGISDHYN